jgi:hypothetical protein
MAQQHTHIYSEYKTALMFYSIHNINSKYNFVLCMWHACKRNAFRALIGKYEKRDLLARPRHKQEVNFQITSKQHGRV